MEILKDKNRRTGLIVTVIFHLILGFIMAFIYLNPPYPPPPQLGVEVNLGDSNEGMGRVQPKKSQQQQVSKPKPSPKADRTVTQNTEQSVKLNDKKKEEKKSKKVEEKKEEPKTDQRFIFKKKDSQKGGSEGQTGKPGDQGREWGTPNADNYVGDGGSGGVTFSLAGRLAKALPKPDKGFKEEGKVTVQVWVDKNGRVSNAKVIYKGTTTTDKDLKRRAIKAAMEARFNTKPDAPEVQVGTITYVFTLDGH